MALPAFGYGRLASAIPTDTAFNISASGLFNSSAKGAVRMRAETANAITHVRFSALLNGSTSDSVKVSIQGLTANGVPDGSIKASGNAYGTVTIAGSSNAIYEVALGTSYTPSAGEAFAVVFEPNGGTPDFSNYVQVNLGYTRAVPFSHHTAALADSGFGGGFSITGTSFISFVVVKTASERYGGMLIKKADSAFSMTTKETTTTGNRVAAKVVLPAADYIASVDISGMLMITKFTGSQSIKAGIWNAAGTELKSVTIDTDYATSSGDGFMPIEFDTPYTAAPGDTLYIGFESVSSSSAKYVVLDFDSTADRDCAGSVPSGSSIIHSAWNGSAWSDSAADVPVIQINLSGITGVDIPTEAEVAAAVWAYAERTLTS